MHLENISLVNFKNYTELFLNFSPKINCFTGPNGSGKTNLLDAIHYLSITKSAFNSIDQQNILHNAPYFMIQGNFLLSEKNYSIQCVQKAGQKKIFKNNKNPYGKISEHVGKFPVVLIAPDDTDIIKESSESRRKFLDSIISQIDPVYLENLMEYNHYLKQRNCLLKDFASRNYFDGDLIEPYDKKIIFLGRKIFLIREKFIQDFQPVFKEHYKNLTEGKEATDIKYQSDLQEDHFEKTFYLNKKKDLLLQRTTSGIHKDDLVFEIDKYPLRKLGSQGQQKSFVIALKLAQFDIIKSYKNSPPLLLLDDIFDKLDDQRIAKLIEMVSMGRFGQLFITDARPERTNQIFSNLSVEKKIFTVTDGKVQPQMVD